MHGICMVYAEVATHLVSIVAEEAKKLPRWVRCHPRPDVST